MSLLQTAISEKLLHFIWEKCYFDIHQLQTVDGKQVHIIKPGWHNQDQGPDFLNAEVSIDGVRWHGHVELHVHADDWYKHRHHEDSNYQATVLHVVWFSERKKITRSDGTTIPELIIGPSVDPSLLQRYDRLRLAETAIPCQSQFDRVPSIIINHWVERLAIERIEYKSTSINQSLQDNKHNWEQVLWEQLASVMGGPVNKAAFLQLAQHIPYRLLQKYRDKLHKIEALLFGGSGMLKQAPPIQSQHDSHPDHYYYVLFKEWQFFASKYQLDTFLSLPMKKLRMRPASFPTIRIAQLSQLVHMYPSIIQLLSLDVSSPFMSEPLGVSPYWETHYQFFNTSQAHPKNMGLQQKRIIMINVILPFSWLYLNFHGRSDTEELITQSMSQLAPENNRITRIYTGLGGQNPNALRSQGFIQLYKHYCSPKRCLECAIGRKILSADM